MSQVIEPRISIAQHLSSLLAEVYFEYDSDMQEYCVFFKEVDGYYGQWKTKNEAFWELIAWYLDTKDA